MFEICEGNSFYRERHSQVSIDKFLWSFAFVDIVWSILQFGFDAGELSKFKLSFTRNYGAGMTVWLHQEICNGLESSS